MNIRTTPMMEKDSLNNIGKPLKTPVRFHLIDCLKELKFGRPAGNQRQISKWILELENNLENGVPFT